MQNPSTSKYFTVNSVPILNSQQSTASRHHCWGRVQGARCCCAVVHYANHGVAAARAFAEWVLAALPEASACRPETTLRRRRALLPVALRLATRAPSAKEARWLAGSHNSDSDSCSLQRRLQSAMPTEKPRPSSSHWLTKVFWRPITISLRPHVTCHTSHVVQCTMRERVSVSVGTVEALLARAPPISL